MDAKNIGVISILGASLMWALEPIFAKLAYINSNFIHTYTIRVIVATLIATIYLFITNNYTSIRINRRYIVKIIYIGIIGTVIADLLYLFSLTITPVINAVLIGHMQPIFILLIGFFMLKEDKLNRYDYLGIIIMMLSGLLVTTRSLHNLSILKFGTIGDLFVLLATIAWATTAIVTRRYLKELNSGVLTFYRFLIASTIFTSYLLFSSSIFLSNIYQISIGVIVGIGTILYYEGLKRIKAAQVSALELSTPFYASILGFIVLGETVTILQIVGISLLIIGIYLLSKKEKFLINTR